MEKEKNVDYSKKFRSWCFTINNPLRRDKKQVISLIDEECDYLVMGLEEGENGTLHYQGFMHFKNARHFRSLMKTIPRAHLEPAFSSVKDNIRYCKKGDQTKDEYNEYYEKGPNYGLNADIIEIGIVPGTGQGRRTDLDEVKKDLLNLDMELFDVANKHFHLFCKHGKLFKEFREMQYKHRDGAPTVYYFWGDSTAGKTYRAKQLGVKGKYYFKDETQWWDMYKQEEVTIIDDYDGSINFRSLLRLLDENPHSVQYKGNYIKFNSPKVAITCDRPIEILYGKLTESEMCQLVRRINYFIYCEIDVDTGERTEKDMTEYYHKKYYYDFIRTRKQGRVKYNIQSLSEIESMAIDDLSYEDQEIFDHCKTPIDDECNGNNEINN